MDRLASMQAFVATADARSFTGAARRLGMSPRMVTKHVEALERRLGVPLLHRSTRRLVLTEAGVNYCDSCRSLLAEVDEIEASISADRLEPRGLLRVNPRRTTYRATAARLRPALSGRHRRTWVDQPAGRSGRGGLGHRRPLRAFGELRAARAPAQHFTYGGLRRTGITCRAWQVSHGVRSGGAQLLALHSRRQRRGYTLAVSGSPWTDRARGRRQPARQ